MPGVHTVGFDGPSETITLSHSVRDRGTFARGALAAARWVHGKRGWFSMRDVLGLTGLMMTDVNHRDTENTEYAQRLIFGPATSLTRIGRQAVSVRLCVLCCPCG